MSMSRPGVYSLQDLSGQLEGVVLGFGVWGLGFGVWGLGFGVWGLGFGVWGLGLGACGPDDRSLIYTPIELQVEGPATSPPYKGSKSPS